MEVFFSFQKQNSTQKKIVFIVNLGNIDFCVQTCWKQALKRNVSTKSGWRNFRY